MRSRFRDQQKRKRRGTTTSRDHDQGCLDPTGHWTEDSKPGEVGGAVSAALTDFYRLLDCAAVYGSEKEISITLNACFSSPTSVLKRNDVFIIVSKVFDKKHVVDGEHPIPEAIDRILSDLGLHPQRVH